jgi:hypothetical protein
MSHLSSERLAELADGEPTIAEAEHLAACAICATERSAHQRLLTLAGDERDRVAPPLTSWATLAARLRDEGIIATGAAAGAGVDGSPGVTSSSPDARVVPLVPPRRHRGAWLAGLRVAAGLIIAATFGALGRISAGASPAPSGREIALTLRQVVGAGGDAGEGLLPQLGSPSGSALAELGAPFASVDDALETLSSSQREYDRAVAFIATHDSTIHSPGARDVYRTRLAALDEMAETSRLALSAAPTDPVLNQYYISTLGAREVTLRQLGSVLTPGKRLSRF